MELIMYGLEPNSIQDQNHLAGLLACFSLFLISFY